MLTMSPNLVETSKTREHVEHQNGADKAIVNSFDWFMQVSMIGIFTCTYKRKNRKHCL